MPAYYRDHFDLDPQLIYLNSGSSSITPRTVTESKIREVREVELNPTASLWANSPRLWSVQKALGGFLGANASELFLRTTVTSAMNAFILGYDDLGPAGGEILVSNHEYGAVVNVCRYRAERSGLKLRSFPLGESPSQLLQMSDAEITSAIVAALRPETRLLMLSQVLTTNGMILPIASIARDTRKRGVLLAIDGAHATGALPMRLEELQDVDFYGGNLHKWAMGPKGTGYGWAPSRHHGRIQALEAGWTTFESADPFDQFGEGSRFQGRMQRSSAEDMTGFLALPAMIEFWERLGADAIYTHRRELRAALLESMSKSLPWPLLSPTDSRQGPLLTWALPDRFQSRGRALIPEVLRETGVQIVINRVVDRWCLRLSPALHNTIEEMERAPRELAKFFS